MLTMVYLPSARRLTVIVVKAVNLKIMDITGASDPYVKVSLWQGGKRLRKRKTTVHRRTVNPVFNEALFFDVAEEQLSLSNLMVQVIDHDRLVPMSSSKNLQPCWPFVVPQNLFFLLATVFR